jgi:hypothetical protein
MHLPDPHWKRTLGDKPPVEIPTYTNIQIIRVLETGRHAVEKEGKEARTRGHRRLCWREGESPMSGAHGVLCVIYQGIWVEIARSRELEVVL